MKVIRVMKSHQNLSGKAGKMIKVTVMIAAESIQGQVRETEDVVGPTLSTNKDEEEIDRTQERDSMILPEIKIMAKIEEKIIVKIVVASAQGQLQEQENEAGPIQERIEEENEIGRTQEKDLRVQTKVTAMRKEEGGDTIQVVLVTPKILGRTKMDEVVAAIEEVGAGKEEIDHGPVRTTEEINIAMVTPPGVPEDNNIVFNIIHSVLFHI